MLYGADAREVFSAQEEFAQFYPQEGWVEHDPELLWQSVRSVLCQVLEHARLHQLPVAALGITNQRETTLVWDRATGQPIYNAIVWQDRRTADMCEALQSDELEAEIQQRSGLLLDPYFSATKVAWILDHVEGARERAARGELAFGTVDSFLIWRLTAGACHVTDVTNASRTNLFNIETGTWDKRLLSLFNVPDRVLPEVKPCCAEFGLTDATITGFPIPITGVAGDQQAASIGQCCFEPGDIKSTYGTGSFVLMNTGDTPVRSSRRLLTTIAYEIDGRKTYALEGSIFVAGASVQWLRDQLGIIQNAQETEALAQSIPTNGGVYLVPAFTGLGVPHWRPDVRGALFGLTRSSGKAEIARAALESVVYQTADLFEVMQSEGISLERLQVDGGMVANNWLLQFLADILNLEVKRPDVLETTALGAAYLAGRFAGIYGDFAAFRQVWRCDRSFQPDMELEPRQALLKGWKHAVQRVTALPENL